MLVIVLIPAVLSGLLISAVVILVTKRRRLMRLLSSWRKNRLATASRATNLSVS
jgi:hypothetical protein